MAKRKDKERNKNRDRSAIKLTSRETSHTILAVGSLALSIFLLLAAMGTAGRAGEVIHSLFGYLFGIGYFILPLVFILLAISMFQTREQSFAMPQIAGTALLFISLLAFTGLVLENRGGILGLLISKPLLSLFGPYASIVILAALVLISVLIIFDTSIKIDLLTFIRKLLGKKETDTGLQAVETAAIDEAMGKFEKIQPDQAAETKRAEAPRPKEANGDGFIPMISRRRGKAWNPPPLSLLERDKGKPGVGDIKANANLIKRTLLNFGIVVEMDEISIGPSVTRYALKPAEGVKLSKILGLQNNLELALAAHPVRIEAPIPGKSLVGIEVPNTTKSTIGLGSLLSDPTYASSEKALLVALGRDITGISRFTDIAKMPHLLIAGATGSGKSVTIHALISSLLYRNPPENLKMIMIDPKRVELTLYNGIPHLLTPVITDPKKAILALKWAAKEMERRYDILEKAGVRDIDSYHKNVLVPELKKSQGSDADGPDTMPYIIVIVDELADLMQSYPRELEAAIVRLAQMSRAVGIHLVLSTQRPSVNVITGLIKANIPARIALQVSSQIDSRTILDAAGAEKLLGAGDMLYLSGEMSKPSRIQSAYISEGEVKEVAKYLRDAYADELGSEINLTQENTSNAIFTATLDSDAASEDDDELYEEARETVMHAGKASTSFLQRKLRVGYARAARLMDILEERGVIGPGSGAKPREVIIAGAASPSPDPLDDEVNEEQF